MKRAFILMRDIRISGFGRAAQHLDCEVFHSNRHHFKFFNESLNNSSHSNGNSQLLVNGSNNKIISNTEPLKD